MWVGHAAYDFSTTDLVRIVASRLTHLMLQELQKINLDHSPPTARRLLMTAMERASAIQKSLLDLLRIISGDIIASPENN